MDVDYSEWDALETMLAKPSCLANVKQLMIEFHSREMNITGLNGTSSRDDLARYWNVLRGIYRLGFKLWNVWNNSICYVSNISLCKYRSRWTPKKSYCGCVNMYFLNVKYLV